MPSFDVLPRFYPHSNLYIPPAPAPAPAPVAAPVEPPREPTPELEPVSIEDGFEGEDHVRPLFRLAELTRPGPLRSLWRQLGAAHARLLLSADRKISVAL